MSEEMTSSRPYFIRAVFEWVMDNELTPYLVIDANIEQVQVPGEYTNEDGTITINISPEACRGLHIGNDRIVFSASFGGNALQVFIPPYAVLAIYAQENGRGMVFTEEEHGGDIPPETSPPQTPSKPPKKGKPKLRVVK